MKADSFLKGFTDISDSDISIIMHVEKTVLFNKDLTWVKQSDSKGSFNVVMRAYDSANVCDLIRLYILDILGKRFPSVLFGLCRYDALVISRGSNGHTK